MKEKYKVSIVVPIYNGMQYLPKIYDIIHNQTYKNFETLLIDDYSSDDSFALMQQYENKDKRFKALQVKTKGGTAVKTQVQAIPYCTGDYYFYLSQDDFFDYDIIEKCIGKALQMDADIVLPNMILYYEDKESYKYGKYPIDNNYDMTLSGKDAFVLSLDWKIHGFALRKMELIKVDEFKAIYYNSEEYYFRKMLLNVNKVAFCDSSFYYRQDNPDAITKGLKYFHVDILTTDMMLYKFLREYKFTRKVRVIRLSQILINWLRYCKRFYSLKLNKKEKNYVFTNLKVVFGNIFKEWLFMVIR